jgi:hypothetical protein
LGTAGPVEWCGACVGIVSSVLFLWGEKG